MSNKSKMYFTSGEFAKLCGTTKETLRHYDSIGLLCPECRGENRYGYYAAWQFFDYDMIDTLKEAGCSLKEIQEYQGHHNTDNFVEFLKEKEKQLEEAQEKLERMRLFLRRTVETTEYALHSVYDSPKLVHCPKEYLIAFPVPEGENLTLVEMIGRMREQNEYLNKRQLGEEYQMGSIVLKDTILSGQYFDSYFYTRIPEWVESERLMVKPEGDYVVMLYKGPFQEIDRAYEHMLAFMKENGVAISGNSYEYDMVTHLATENARDYITEIAIQIEAAGTLGHLPLPAADNI